MAKSLIRKTQLHPDISDLVSGYGSLFFPTLGQYYSLSGSVNLLSGSVNLLSGSVNSLSGLINIFSGNVDFFSDQVKILSGNVDFLSGNVNTFSGQVQALSRSVVYTTGNQSISGVKNFLTRPTLSGLNLITTGDLINLEINVLGLDGLESEILVDTTGNQEVFGHKKFANISNLQNAPFLASGEGKHIEKYFNVNLNSGNIIYNSPKYRNSFIFLNISKTGVYSVYLPSVTGSYETDYIRYIVDRLPLNTAQTGITGQTGITSLAWHITGWPTNVNPSCPGCSGIDIPLPVTGPSGNCDTCIENFLLLEDIGFINNDTNNNASINNNIRINFYTDKFTQFITGQRITGYVPTGSQVSGTGLYTNYEQSILIYSLLPESKDKVSFIFRDGYWDLENENIALTPDSLPNHTHSFGDIIDLPTVFSTPFSGNRQITANVLGFKNLIPGGEDVVSFLNNVFFPFIPASISLNGYPLQEKGVPLQNIIYAGVITQNQETNISNLQLTKNNVVFNTISIPAYGSFNYTTSESLNSDGNIGVILSVRNNGSPTTISSTQNIIFEAPMYYGSGVPNLTETLIKNSFIKQVESKSNKTRRFSANNQKLYMVVPQGWNLVSVIDGAGFNNFPGWGSRQSTFLLQNSTPQNYIIWETLNLNTVNNFDLTFNFN